MKPLRQPSAKLSLKMQKSNVSRKSSVTGKKGKNEVVILDEEEAKSETSVETQEDAI